MNRAHKWGTRLAIVGIISVLLISSFCPTNLICKGAEQMSEAAISDSQITSFDGDSYFNYYEQYKEMDKPLVEDKYDGLKYTSCQNINSVSQTIEDKTGAKIGNDNSWCEWEIKIQKAGTYGIELDYYPLEGTGKDILISVMLDGILPFEKAEDISLTRVWKDIPYEGSSRFYMDDFGNELCPKQVEAPHFVTKKLSNLEGLYTDPYAFYLAEGVHTLRIVAKRESLIINRLTIVNEEALPSYEQYKATCSDAVKAEGNVVFQQAELAMEKTSSILYPTYDKSNAATEPADPDHTRLNTIGQTNWNKTGMAISWKVDVPKSGLYQLAFKTRQNFNQGMNSYRALYINGKVPFQEASQITFPYADDWYMKVLGDTKPFLVYLKKGDVLTLDVTTGKMGQVLREIQQAALNLNEIYRDIIIITGSAPDIYRDYGLEKQIPGLVNSLKTVEKELNATYKNVKSIIGKSGSQAAIINQVTKILNELASDTYTIPERLGNFKGAIENLGSLILSLNEQPLELDYIAFVPIDNSIPKAKVAWYKELVFGWRQFFGSFLNDYNSISKIKNSAQKRITVWVSTGRDQAQILNNLIVNDFSKKSNSNVKLSIVDTGDTLIKATLAGRGPDAALMIAQDVPVNLAMRGALVDLSKDKYKISDIDNQFYPSAWTPFIYNGGVYGLPETQVFDVLFYRTDIFKQLKLSPPKTWKDFYTVLEVLQNKNLQVGIPEINAANMGVSAGISTFDKFLFQNGGEYYNKKLSKTLFDEEVAFKAFEQWVELYSRYGLDQSYDFLNRFRSGEMPMAIQNYNAYNQLIQAAPEIRGEWAFSCIPGTVQEDGVVNKSESSGSTGCIMLKKAETDQVADEVFTFLKWWISDDIQIEYGKELEATMGIAARYAPASKHALAQMGWTSDELSVLTEQQKWIKNPYQIPGNYTISRSLTSAFRAAVKGINTSRRSLAIYDVDINDEIMRKRNEFNLN